MARVLVLGGGFGGVAAAVALRQRMGDRHQVTLVDRREHFLFGFRKTWAFLGSSTLTAGMRPLTALEERGIQIVRADISAIDPVTRSATLERETLQGDYLVIALGAQAAPQAVPGFAEHGISFYTSELVESAAQALVGFEGGRVVVAILGTPYPCPPAPFETALLLQEHFEARQLRAELAVYSPLPRSLPILGEAGCSIIEDRLAGSGIAFHPNHTALRVEAGRVQFDLGRADFDLLIGVPGHVCPQVVVAAGLAEPGKWAEVDPETLQTRHPGVYALGDMVSIPLADGKQLPKAGVFAEAQAEVVAEHIAAEIEGRKPTTRYQGDGYCFLEVGAGSAMLVRGDFFAKPRPAVDVIGPAPEHLAAKHDLEVSRLGEWFGTAERANPLK